MFNKMLKRVLLENSESSEDENYSKSIMKLDVENIKIKNMPAFELERTLRIREELENQLEEQREISLKRQHEREVKWEAAMKEKAFMDSALQTLTEYNKVAQRVENRWKKKAADDLGVYLTTTKRIGELEKRNRDLKRQLQKLNSELKVARVYKQTIEDVHAESKGDFTTVAEIPDKFFLLQKVKNELLGKEAVEIESNISRRSQGSSYVNRKMCELHAFDYYGYELQIYHDGLLLELRRLERIASEKQRNNASNILLVAKLKASILNLYLKICTALHKDPIVKRDDYESQLKQVKLFLGEMKKLTDDSRNGTSKSSIAANVEDLKGRSLLRQKISNKKQTMKLIM